MYYYIVNWRDVPLTDFKTFLQFSDGCKLKETIIKIWQLLFIFSRFDAKQLNQRIKYILA